MLIFVVSMMLPLKVLKVADKSDQSRQYYVHYDGWNKRHDNWIGNDQIVSKVDDEVPKRRGRPSVTSNVIIITCHR